MPAKQVLSHSPSPFFSLAWVRHVMRSKTLESCQFRGVSGPVVHKHREEMPILRRRSCWLQTSGMPGKRSVGKRNRGAANTANRCG
jgi:hypothetical protein